MSDFTRPLGDTIKKARTDLDMTQSQVAELIDGDVRTIINIENYRGNPKLEVLYPLVRTLKIDAREIFQPEIKRDSPVLCQLRYLIEDCSEEEAAALIPVIESVLSVFRSKHATVIK